MAWLWQILSENYDKCTQKTTENTGMDNNVSRYTAVNTRFFTLTTEYKNKPM